MRRPNLVDILDPNEENLVAISVVPWQVNVRLDATQRQNWEVNGWAEYPQSRHYDAAYACKPEGACTATAQDDNLPADPGEDWAGCLDEHRVDGLGHADLPAAEDLLDVPADPGLRAGDLSLAGGEGVRMSDTAPTGQLSVPDLLRRRSPRQRAYTRR